MEQTRVVEHPADFRADAKIGGVSVVKLIMTGGALMIGLVFALVLLLSGTTLWKVLLTVVTTIVLALQLSLDLYRRISRAAIFAVRPRWRPSDASRPVTRDTEQTVQDMFKVNGGAGPFVEFQDGRFAMVLRVQPTPTNSLSPLQFEQLRLRFQLALKRAAESKVEIGVYSDVEPDLVRPELDRQEKLARQFSPGSGIRTLAEARIAYHRHFSSLVGRRTVHHIRLSIHPDLVPLAHPPRDEQDLAEQVVTYLRDVGMGVAAEMQSVGLKMQPLGPEGIRDLASRQLDPTGWRMAEPPRGVDWSWSVGGERAVLTVPKQTAPPEIAAPVELVDRAEVRGVEQHVTGPLREEVPELHLAPQQAGPHEESGPAATGGVERLTPEPPPAPSGEPQVVYAPVAPAERLAEEPVRTQTVVPPLPEPPSMDSPAPVRQIPERRTGQGTALGGSHGRTRELIAVAGADRRTGTSLVAANVALAYRQQGNSVAVITLDGGRNSIAEWLGVSVIVSGNDWAIGGEDLFVPGPRGLTVIPGPTRLSGIPFQPLSGDTVTRVIGKVRREFDVVVVDLGAESTTEQRAALEQSTGVMIVASPDVDAWAGVQRRMQEATAQGIRPESIAVIVNRAKSEAIRHHGQVDLILPEDPEIQESLRVGSVPGIGVSASPWVQTLAKWLSTL